MIQHDLSQCQNWHNYFSMVGTAVKTGLVLSRKIRWMRSVSCFSFTLNQEENINTFLTEQELNINYMILKDRLCIYWASRLIILEIIWFLFWYNMQYRVQNYFYQCQIHLNCFKLNTSCVNYHKSLNQKYLLLSAASTFAQQRSYLNRHNLHKTTEI